MHDDLEFPDNVVQLLKDMLDEDVEFELTFGRPLRPSDPNGSAGIFAALWIPTEYEIGQYDPAVSRYSIQIQTLAKNATEEEGISKHSRLAKRVRVMLYRNPDLRVQLGSLKTESDELTERTQRWGISSQNYLANEIDGQFLYLAVTDFWLETETI